MKTALSVVAVTAILATSNLSALQTAAGPEGAVIRAGIPESVDELTPDVRLYVSKGDMLRSQLRFSDAALEYRRAADIARREGHLASGTTWMLANAHYNAGNLIDAAEALDQLTTEASEVGELSVQALAMFNSAWLYGKAGRKAETAARVARLEGLLRSPYMPVAIRDRLSSWLKTSKELAVAAQAS